MASPDYVRKANMEKVMHKQINKALEAFTMMCYARSVELCPAGQEGYPELRTALMFQVDYDKHESYIGLPKGHSYEKIAFYNEFGTGQRGQESFKQYFQEKRPAYEIPILPKHYIRTRSGLTVLGYMHFKGSDGKDVFMRQSKGMAGRSFLRRSVFENKEKLPRIMAKYFDKNAIKDIEVSMKTI